MLRIAIYSFLLMFSFITHSFADDVKWNPLSPYSTDIVIGAETAPITVVEYASLTCPHCKRFHEDSWPEIKAKWIDSGQVKFIFRHLPLDQSALAGAMAVSCVPNELKEGAITTLFADIDGWAADNKKIYPVLTAKFGNKIDPNKLLLCMSQAELPVSIMVPGTDGINNGVEATPFFYINGKTHEGFISAEDFSKLLVK